MMKTPEGMSSEDLARSRHFSDSKLIREGANFSPGKYGPRLNLTPEQLEEIKKENSLLNKEEKSEIDLHYDWVVAHAWQYLSWIKSEYGGIEKFEKAIASPSKDISTSSNPEGHYIWIRTHMWRYLTFIKKRFGNLSEFEEMVIGKVYESARKSTAQRRRAA